LELDNVMAIGVPVRGRQFLKEDPLDARMLPQMPIGVSARRKHERSFETAPPGTDSIAMRRLSISRRFVQVHQPRDRGVSSPRPGKSGPAGCVRLRLDRLGRRIAEAAQILGQPAAVGAVVEVALDRRRRIEQAVRPLLEPLDSRVHGDLPFVAYDTGLALCGR
jgi:hypothetical protein